jgi:hypothetical protein
LLSCKPRFGGLIALTRQWMEEKTGMPQTHRSLIPALMPCTCGVQQHFEAYQVVQSHRRLRHIAPGSFFGKIIGAGRDSRGTATHPLASRGIVTELDRCQTCVSCGLAAAHLRCRHCGGAERSERHRVSQTAGTRLGSRHYGFLPEIQPGCLFPPGQPPGPAEGSYH